MRTKLYIFLRKNNHARCESTRYQLVGMPCRSWDEACKMIGSYLDCDSELQTTEMVENGQYYDEIDKYTGEIKAEWLMRIVEL